MQKEILAIDVDEELNTTEVMIRVPEFDNFGQRLNEIEQLMYESIPDDSSDLETSPEDALAKLSLPGADSEKQLQAKIESLPDGPEKKALLVVQENIAKIQTRMDADEEENELNDDLSDEEEEALYAEAEHDIHQFIVTLPEGVAWDEESERKVDRFLTNWPKLKDKVLLANYEVYESVYPVVKELMEGDPAAQHVFPEPKGPESIADYFSVDTLHLRADKKIGLSGHCTWDEEHGWGVLLYKGAVVGAGGSDEAFC